MDQWLTRTGVEDLRKQHLVICATCRRLSGRTGVFCKATSEKVEPSISKTFSQRTTRRKLKELGFRGWTAQKNPFISDINKRQRVQWTHKHKRMTVEKWGNTVFTDESKVRLNGSDGRVCVWRKCTEEWLPICIVGTV